MRVATYNGVTGVVMPMTLKREWFNKILSGKKRIEYRDGSEYWINRFMGKKPPKFIRFANGYNRNSPAFTIECVGIRVVPYGNETEADKFEKEFSITSVSLEDAFRGVCSIGFFEIKLGRIVGKENIFTR